MMIKENLNKVIWPLSLAVLIVFGISCNGSVEQEPETAPEPEVELSEKAQLVQNIEKLEPLVYTGENGTISAGHARELHTLYLGFANSNPLDEATAEYLFKAGNLARGLLKFEQAIAHFERIRKNYPRYERLAESTFLVAFIYEVNLNQQGTAKGIYQEVVDSFPGTRFAEDAQASIENMGMSEEDLIKKFKRQNQDPG